MHVKFDSFNQVETPILIMCNPGSTFNIANNTITNAVGIISEFSDLEFNLNFNSISEINFRAYKLPKDSDLSDSEADYVTEVYNSIQNRRMIFIPDIGFFSISYVDATREGNLIYKDVTAQSAELEIQNKVVPFIEDGTYSFGDLMNLLLAQIPLWSLGEVDPNVAAKYRSFEDVDDSQNIYAFMLEDMQDAYECIFDFDCINRIISVYDQNNYVEDTHIFITHEDFINSLTVSEDSSNLYTAMSVSGDNDIGISAINPLGGNTIYNFDYYLSWMSEGLRAAVKKWDSLVSFYSAPAITAYIRSGATAYSDSWLSLTDGGPAITPAAGFKYCIAPNANSGSYEYKVYFWSISSLKYVEAYTNYTTSPTYNYYSYYDLNLLYYSLLSQKSNLDSELARLNTQRTMYQRCRDNIVANESTDSVAGYNEVIEANGGEPIDITELVIDVVANIDSLLAAVDSDIAATQSSIDSLTSRIDTIRSAIEAIYNALNIESYFTPEQVVELHNYIYEGSYNDEYVIITDTMNYLEQFAEMKTLYDRAVQQLEKISQPSQEFNVDSENFIFEKTFEEWAHELKTGCLINVELEQDDVAKLFLSGFVVNFEDHTLSMTFGNRFNKYDSKSLFNDVLGNVQKSANTLSYVKDILYPIKTGELNQMQEVLSNSRNLTKDAALAATNEEVIIDDTGYLGRKSDGTGGFEPTQIKITGERIVFTDDNWESSKLAMGSIILDDNTSVYGINAEAVIGDIIMGNQLRILDNNGQDILTVVDNKVSSKVTSAQNTIQENVNNQISGVEGQVKDLNDQFDEYKEDTDKKFDDIEDTYVTQTELTQTAEDLSLKISQMSVDQVVTETGYRFDKDGLNITSSSSDISNRIDNEGMYVTRGTGGNAEDVLVADDEGVNAINLTARQYLIVGLNSRFENYDNGTDSKRTGCFYIGG